MPSATPNEHETRHAALQPSVAADPDRQPGSSAEPTGAAHHARSRERGSRTDVATDDYIDELADLLADGWSGFTGTVEQEDAATPDGVPPEYVMQPFSIRLAFRGRHWLTVEFELGHDEIGSTKTPNLRIADDLITLFDSLGLETPAPIPVLALEHQIAQKLNACTDANPKTGQNDRAHDLVDLQILEQEEAIDMAAVAATAERLFTARQGHEWPPTVVQYDRWETIYTEAADNRSGDRKSAKPDDLA